MDCTPFCPERSPFAARDLRPSTMALAPPMRIAMWKPSKLQVRPSAFAQRPRSSGHGRTIRGGSNAGVIWTIRIRSVQRSDAQPRLLPVKRDGRLLVKLRADGGVVLAGSGVLETGVG